MGFLELLSGRTGVVGPAVGALSWLRRAECPFAALAVLQRDQPGRERGQGQERGRWRKPGGEPVSEETGRTAQPFGWEFAGKGVLYGVGADLALQPCDDPWGQGVHVLRGKQQAGVLAVQPGEQVGGGPEEGRGGEGRLRYEQGRGLTTGRRLGAGPDLAGCASSASGSLQDRTGTGGRTVRCGQSRPGKASVRRWSEGWLQETVRVTIRPLARRVRVRRR